MNCMKDKEAKAETHPMNQGHNLERTQKQDSQSDERHNSEAAQHQAAVLNVQTKHATKATCR
jgi:hypothetical protein